jgi:hypothetical protein
VVVDGSTGRLYFRYEARVPKAHLTWYKVEDFFEEVLGSPEPWPQANIWRKDNLAYL